jgi:hypothetical protein
MGLGLDHAMPTIDIGLLPRPASSIGAFSAGTFLGLEPLNMNTAPDMQPAARSRPGACADQGKGVLSASPFLRLPPPRWAFSSPGPCRHQGSFSWKSGCYGHIRSLRTPRHTPTTGPRTIPRHPGAHIDEAAGHAVIWGGALGVRRGAQGARDGGLSVPHRRRRVCAIDHTVRDALRTDRPASPETRRQRNARAASVSSSASWGSDNCSS